MEGSPLSEDLDIGNLGQESDKESPSYWSLGIPLHAELSIPMTLSQGFLENKGD